MPRRHRPARLLATLSVLGLVVLAGAGACAKHDPKGRDVASISGTARPSASGAAGKGDPVKYQQCMQDHGVDVHIFSNDSDDGAGGTASYTESSDAPSGPPVSKEQMDKAEEACRQYAPHGGEPPKSDPQHVEALRKYAKCMRDNGVTDFPDPSADGGIQIQNTQGPGGDLDPHSDVFKKADQACHSMLPSPKANPAPGSTS
jgi:hypothetical protein